MKYMAALVAIVICFPCLADDMEQAVEEAKAAGIEAIVAAAEIDPVEFEVSTKSHENGVDYFRRDQLVLRQLNSHPIYSLWDKGQHFARVVVKKDWSPQIILEPNLDFNVILTPLEEGAWELTAYGTDPDFLEIYIVTSESVRLVSAETYLRKLAEGQGSRAAFKSIGDSLLEGLETGETE